MTTRDPDPHLFNPADPQPPIDPSIAEHATWWLFYGLGVATTLVLMVAVLAILARTKRVQFTRRRRLVTR